MGTKRLTTIALLLFYSIVALSQSDTTFWNSNMQKIANTGGHSGFIKLKEANNFSHNEFFLKNKDAFRLSDNDEMILINSKYDDLGHVHYLYQQRHNGIKIEGAEYKLHEINSRISTANGKLLINMNKQSNPSISEAVALQNALKIINASKYAWEVKNPNGNYYSTYPVGELIFTKEHDSLSFEQINFLLCYKFDIFSIEPYARNHIYIDANTGKFIKMRTRIISDNCHNGTAQTLYNGQQTITTYHRWLTNDYILKDNCRGNDIHTFLSGDNVDDSDNQWSLLEERPATSAHWATEMTYDYYYNTFGRNSFDNNGAEMLVYANDNSSGQDNAFWNGSSFHYGSGNGGLTTNALVSLDVVGHEYTHAVTENEANLIYSYESGALNESFSDIFGTMVEFYVVGNNGNYFLGEDFWIQDGKLRDMSNPNSKNQPDTYLGTFWHTASTDNGGVHTNNGVQNYWFFLLSEGGSGINDNGKSYNVEGIGRDKAAAIAYRNLTVYLSSSSDFSDAKNGSIWAAMDLFGSCSNEVLQTILAWNAVGVLSTDVYDIIVDCDNLKKLHEGYTIGYPPFQYTVPPQPVSIKAMNNLTSNCNITSGGESVTFIAGNQIRLLAGFHSGDNFRAYIEPCIDIANKSMRIVNNEISDSWEYKESKDEKRIELLIEDNSFKILPNPFSDSPEIIFNISEPTDINIYITNLHGQKIMTIYKNKTDAGEHRIIANTSSLTNGIYFCVFETATERRVLKIVKI